MEKELKKLNAFLKRNSKGLHGEIDYGEDYGIENATTLIAVDRYGNIVGEGETADEVIPQIR